MTKPVVAVIDSGVGGVTLVDAIRLSYPYLDILYGNDNKHFPYGNRQESDVRRIVTEFCMRLYNHHKFDALVVGCNTASTLVLPELRQLLHVPVVGVVPAIKPAVKSTRSGAIALLGTPGTIARQYTKDLIQEFAKDVRVTLIGSAELVKVAEDKARGKVVDLDALRLILEPAFHHDTDTIVLGCTHFPLLRPELARVLPSVVELIDSGDAIARRVGQVLGLKPGDEVNGPGAVAAVFSRQDAETKSLEGFLRAHGVVSICHLAD